MKVCSSSVKIGDIETVEITIKNSAGMTVSFLTYGGIITGIWIPDKDGMTENVVLSYDDYEDYTKNPAYFGAIVGRTAGRIKDAYFSLNGQNYLLEQNYGPNQGHGGWSGFSKRIFEHNIEERESEIHVTLAYTSHHLEGGYPGEVSVKVSYILNEINEFKIIYEAVPSTDTLINLTNHSYFNLSGSFEESILYHELMMQSDSIAELDDTSSTTGKLIDVVHTPFDFRFMKEIGEDFFISHPQLILGNGYDHPYLLKNEKKPQIRLAHRFSGRVLEIETDNQAAVIYTQNYTENQRIPGNKILATRRAIAIETQRLPIGVDQAFIEHSVCKAGEKFSTFTLYRFLLEDVI